MRVMEGLPLTRSSNSTHSLADSGLCGLAHPIPVPFSVVVPSLCWKMLVLSCMTPFLSEVRMRVHNADCLFSSFNSQIPSQALPRRLTAVPKTEKPPARKKSGHPAPGSLRSRAGIWRWAPCPFSSCLCSYYSFNKCLQVYVLESVTLRNWQMEVL